MIRRFEPNPDPAPQRAEPTGAELDAQLKQRQRRAASIVFTSAAMSIGWIADALSVLADGPLAAETERVQQKLGELIAELGILARKAMESEKGGKS